MSVINLIRYILKYKNSLVFTIMELDPGLHLNE